MKGGRKCERNIGKTQMIELDKEGFGMGTAQDGGSQMSMACSEESFEDAVSEDIIPRDRTSLS